MARWKPTERRETDVRSQLRARFVEKIERYGAAPVHRVEGIAPIASLASYWQRYVDELDSGQPVTVTGMYLRDIPGCRREGRYQVDADGLITDA